MNSWFADTFCFLVMRNPKDVCHIAAVEAAQRLPKRRLITTAWILTEVGDALAAPANRQGFLDLPSMLQNYPQVSIVPGTSDLFARGIAFFGSRMDKAWTLTDCISFVVMHEHGISEALTGALQRICRSAFPG